MIKELLENKLAIVLIGALLLAIVVLAYCAKQKERAIINLIAPSYPERKLEFYIPTGDKM